MPNRHNSHDLRQRYKDDSLGSPQAQDCDPKSSNSNARHTQDPNTSESSSSSSSHQSTATHDRDSDPNDPHAGRWRRINALGGLGSALEHMVGNVPERRAERARVDALRVAQQQQQQQAEPRHHHRRGTTNEIRHHSHGGLETIASPGAREGRYAQVDDEGRLHRVSEMDVRRLSREDRAGDGEADEREGDEYPFPYTPRRDGARGVRGRGEEYGDEEEDEEYDDEGGYTPRGYGGRGRSSRRA